jgi:TolB-like protein
MKTDISNRAFRHGPGRAASGRKALEAGVTGRKGRGWRLPAGFLALLLGALFLFMVGCGGTRQTFYKLHGFNARTIKKVAVLPLDPLAGDKNSGERFRMAIIAELLSKGVDVVEPGEVIRVMVDMDLQSLRSLTVKDIQEIGTRLGADYVMTGSVGSYAMRKGARVSYPDVSITLLLWEVSSGEIVWSVWHATGGATFASRHFGAEGRTLNEAVQEVVKEAINVLFYPVF